LAADDLNDWIGRLRTFSSRPLWARCACGTGTHQGRLSLAKGA